MEDKIEDQIEEKKVEEKLEQSNDLVLFNLLQENLKVSKEILEISKYVKKYIFWDRLFFWVKTFFILIPVILALIYLPPFLKDAFKSFNDVIAPFTAVTSSYPMTEDSGK